MDTSKFTKWDINLAEFRGSTISSLEYVNKELNSLEKRIRALEKSNIKLNIRVATIAGTISLIVAILGVIINCLI